MRLELLVVDKKETVNKVMTLMYVDQVTGVQEPVAVELCVQNVSCIERVIHVVEWNIVYTDIQVWTLV